MSSKIRKRTDIRLLRVEDVAYMCNVPKKTVERWVQQNHLGIPFFRLGERTLRFSEAGIHRWILESAQGDERFIQLSMDEVPKHKEKGQKNE